VWIYTYEEHGEHTGKKRARTSVNANERLRSQNDDAKRRTGTLLTGDKGLQKVTRAVRCYTVIHKVRYFLKTSRGTEDTL
jgi:hypothetical protein